MKKELKLTDYLKWREKNPLAVYRTFEEWKKSITENKSMKTNTDKPMEWEKELNEVIEMENPLLVMQIKKCFKQAIQATREETIQEIDAFFRDHYWDGLQDDKELVFKHWKFIVDSLTNKSEK